MMIVSPTGRSGLYHLAQRAWAGPNTGRAAGLLVLTCSYTGLISRCRVSSTSFRKCSFTHKSDSPQTGSTRCLSLEAEKTLPTSTVCQPIRSSPRLPAGLFAGSLGRVSKSGVCVSQTARCCCHTAHLCEVVLGLVGSLCCCECCTQAAFVVVSVVSALACRPLEKPGSQQTPVRSLRPAAEKLWLVCPGPPKLPYIVTWSMNRRWCWLLRLWRDV